MFGRKHKKNNQNDIVDRALRFATPSEMEQNDRKSGREVTWHQCTLKTAENEKHVGIVIDYSDKGIQVRFHSHQALPEFVSVSVPALKIHRRAKVVWRKLGDAGLSFID